MCTSPVDLPYDINIHIYIMIHIYVPVLVIQAALGTTCLLLLRLHLPPVTLLIIRIMPHMSSF
jgi:hypothetical protein